MSGFFDATHVPLVRGRAFQSTDTSPVAGVAIVNETMARTFWSGVDPIGQRLRPGGTKPWLTVVGVAGDVKQTGVDQPVRPEVYVLVDQLATPTLSSFLSVTPPTMHVVVRSTLSLAALAPAIRTAVRHVAPNVPVAGLREMDEVFAESIRRPRLLADLLTLFSILALLLAAIGTYALLASTVAERRREIGIRLALGLQRRRLLVEVLRQGQTQTAAGVAAGLVVALGLNRALGSLLFGVTPADPLTFAVALPAIVAVAALASWFPAWRASRLDPLAVLRAD
jgi:predicted lysophospholipase L1 biosynthesis ABC-type transport system permease subunit